MNNSKITYGIVSRICKAELPYLKVFFNHHIKTGFSYFYFIVQDKTINHDIENILSFGKENFEIFNSSNSLSINESLQFFDIRAVKTDYLLSIDIDEYFYDEAGNDVDRCMQMMGYPNVLFLRWIISSVDFISQDRLKGFLGHTGKSLAKTKYIDFINTPHTFKLKNIDQNIKLTNFKNIFCLHYWGRSFNDVVLKCLYQDHLESDSPKLFLDHNKLKKISLPDELPFRLKVLAMLVKHKSNISLTDLLSDNIDSELEDFLLNKILDHKALKKIKELYIDYKEMLDYDRHVSIYPNIGSINDMYKFLP